MDDAIILGPVVNCLSRGRGSNSDVIYPIMASEGTQRHLDRLLDQIEEEDDQPNWPAVLSSRASIPLCSIISRARAYRRFLQSEADPESHA